MLTTSSALLDRLVQSRTHEDWARFVGIYNPLLTYWARRFGFQNDDIQDAVQEAFIKIACSLPSYERRTRPGFRFWLHALCRNCFTDFRRRRRNRPLAGAEEVLANLEDSFDLSAVEELEYRRHLVQTALALIRREFKETIWKAFQACAIDGMAPKEVAANLGIGVRAVYMARHHVLARLRSEVEDLLD